MSNETARRGSVMSWSWGDEELEAGGAGRYRDL